MHDIRLLRDHPEILDAAMARRNGSWDKERFLELDKRRRAAISEVEQLQAQRNSASKEIGALMKAGKADEAEEAKAGVRTLNERIAVLDAERDEADAAMTELLSHIPNIPADCVPEGKDDSENVEVKKWGTPRDFAAEGFEPKPHWDLGVELGILDFDRGVKLAGTRFTLLAGLGATLERALGNYFVDTHRKHGFKEFWPPVIANRATLYGTGQLPKFEDDMFHVRSDGEDMYLISTAEVALTNIHRDETLDGARLPLHYTAFTPCFREEAGSAGRDTRGIIRQHEFDKVEMVMFSKPEDSDNQLKAMIEEAEFLLQELGLPYHIVNLCGGDFGLLGAPDVRPRGVAAELQQLQGDLELLELRRLPGPSREHPLQRPGELQGHAFRAHAQRQRPAVRAHDGRDHRELPERRRHRDRARGAAPLHGRPRGHRSREVGACKQAIALRGAPSGAALGSRRAGRRFWTRWARKLAARAVGEGSRDLGCIGSVGPG